MTDKKLKSHRVKIDKIDKEIYALIQKRASHAVAIGKIKSKVSPKESFYKPDRETKILRNILNANKKGLLPDSKIRALILESGNSPFLFAFKIFRKIFVSLSGL